MRDDHPATGFHRKCKVDHHGRGVKPHCRCGASWPCPVDGLPIIRAKFTMPDGSEIFVGL